MLSHNIKIGNETTSKILFPLAPAHSIAEYFALPKNKREKWGIYLMPISLPCNILESKEEDEDTGFSAFAVEIRKQYPIQGFIREWLMSWDNPVYGFIQRIFSKCDDVKHNIKRFINPCCPRMRKAYPRHGYKDITGAVTDINFALILDFWYEEVVDGHVNWQSDDIHIKFYNELKAAVHFIEVERPKLQDAISNALNKADKTREEQYLEYASITKQAAVKDTETLNWFITSRDFFWT